MTPKGMIMRVDEAVVISLPERADRLQALRQHLPTPWPFPPLRVHPGVRDTPPPFWRSSAGAWGCRQAHLQVLASAYERAVPTTLILEDDAVFAPGFSEHWANLHPRVPRRCSMLMLGGQHTRAPQPAGAHLVRCLGTQRTHAYIIRLNAIPFLMRLFHAACEHIDHSLTAFQDGAFVYAPTRFLIGQIGGHSDISNKDNPTRFW